MSTNMPLMPSFNTSGVPASVAASTAVSREPANGAKPNTSSAAKVIGATPRKRDGQVSSQKSAGIHNWIAAICRNNGISPKCCRPIGLAAKARCTSAAPTANAVDTRTSKASPARARKGGRARDTATIGVQAKP